MIWATSSTSICCLLAAGRRWCVSTSAPASRMAPLTFAYCQSYPTTNEESISSIWPFLTLTIHQLTIRYLVINLKLLAWWQTRSSSTKSDRRGIGRIEPLGWHLKHTRIKYIVRRKVLDSKTQQADGCFAFLLLKSESKTHRGRVGVCFWAGSQQLLWSFFPTS